MLPSHSTLQDPSARVCGEAACALVAESPESAVGASAVVAHFGRLPTFVDSDEMTSVVAYAAVAAERAAEGSYCQSHLLVARPLPAFVLLSKRIGIRQRGS